jgi:hypothetical protein
MPAEVRTDAGPGSRRLIVGDARAVEILVQRVVD